MQKRPCIEAFIVNRSTKKEIRLAGFLFLFLVSFVSSAQRFNFHNLNIDLPSECYSVLQDSKGYMWFSSEDGLYRYDGNSLKCFNTTNGLPDNNVFQLYEDLEGRILFTTLVGKIGYIEHDSVVFPPLNQKLEVLLGYGHGLVHDMYEDANHILWISCYAGIFKTAKANNYSDIEKIVSPCDSCEAGTIIIDGRKAITTRFALSARFTKRQARAFFEFPGRKVSTIPDYNKGAGYVTYRKVLLLSNGNILWTVNNYIYVVKPDGSFSKMVFSKRVLSLYQDKTGGVWIGLKDEGVWYYKDASLTGRPLISLAGYSVSSVIMDNEGGIWASTLEKSIFYANTKSVIDYTNIDELNRKISAIKTIDNKLMVGSSGRALNIVTDTGVLKINFPAEYATEVTRDYIKYKGEILIATANYLLKVDTVFAKWSVLYRKHFKLPSLAMFCLIKAHDDKIYSVNSYELFRIDGDSTDTLKTIPVRATSLCSTSKGELLIASIKGLYKYADSACIYLGDKNKLLTSAIYTIREDRDSTLWIMTASEGIVLYKNNKVVRTITVQNGLASNNVFDVAFDKDGNAWVGSDNGLSKIYTAKNYMIENFSGRHGIISGEILKVIIKDGKIWLGTSNGLCAMDIAQATINKVPPPVYISAVYNEEKLLSKQTDFKYNANNFRFAVNGLTYKDNKQRFIYRLEGLDTGWHSTNSVEISFNALPPGNYTFEVKALNADNVSSVIPAIFSFTIEKPFWLKWWFIILEILSGAALTYLFIQLRLKSITKKEEEKTRVNKIIAEYEITALRTQMNPHFIFNAINSIQHYVLQNNGREAYSYLAKFSRLIRMMLNKAQEKKLTLQQELEMLELYIQLEQLRFSESFKFQLNVDDKIDTEQVLIPAMLIQPYVENAIWHGLMNLKDKSGAMLSITIIQEDTMLKIIVQDNGVGRVQAKALQKDNTHRSVGMELTRKRTEILSKIPGEEKVSIEVFDLYDEDDRTQGTKVDISISNILS